MHHRTFCLSLLSAVNAALQATGTNWGGELTSDRQPLTLRVALDSSVGCGRGLGWGLASPPFFLPIGGPHTSV